MRKKLFILSVILTSFIALVSIMLRYRTSYSEIDITDKLARVQQNLSQNQEIVVFNSKNPFNFNDLLFNLKSTTNQRVYGILSYPKESQNYSSKRPLSVVIGVAGSKGWSDHHYGYMDRYLEQGFATFILHSFDSRNVSSTVGEQISATTAMLVYDSFKSLEQLSKNSKIDAKNVGIIGWSLGGGVALFTAWKPLKDKISPKHTFAAHLPIYPPCMVMPKTLHFTDSPVHILIGDSDDWVPATPCVEMVDLANASNLKITTYPESHHSFDREQEIIYVEDAYSFTDCRLELSDDGIVRSENLGIPLSNPIMQKIILAFCAERGAHYGGNDRARLESKDFALRFMEEHLKKTDN